MRETILGALIGDIAGSRFEFDNHRSKKFELLAPECKPTDDSVMTLAVAQALMEAGEDEAGLPACAVKWMRELGRRYPDAGYGLRFDRWLYERTPEPYGSWGNGAAMRISPVGFFARSEAEVKRLSRAVTAVTHGHPQGIRGAEATAMAIFLARQGASLAEIRARVERDYYRINFALDEIRPSYRFTESCQGSVPQALEAFFESTGFEDAIRNAVSIGGDSDTIAAIAGGIAAAYYGVPGEIAEAARGFLDDCLREILDRWQRFLQSR